MVEHKRLVCRAECQCEPILSPHEGEKTAEPIPKQASAQIRVLGTLFFLFCLRGLRAACPSSLLAFRGKENLKNRICVFLTVFMPLALFCATAHADHSGDKALRLCNTSTTASCSPVDADHNDDSARGRLEIYHDGAWKGVCDDYFTGDEAEVACKQLGYQKHEFSESDVPLDGPSPPRLLA